MTNVSAHDSDGLTDSDFWDGEWQGITLPSRLELKHHGARAFDTLFRRVLRPGPLHLLEVGCAPGRFLIHFAEQFGYSVAGIDYSPLGCRLTRRNLSEAGVTGDVVMGDIFAHPLAPQSFDVVFSAGVIEHFVDPLPILRCMNELIRPGGFLFATVPNFAGLTGLQCKLLDRDIYEKHNPLTVADLRTSFQELQLTDIQTGCFGSLRIQSPHFPNSSVVSKALWFATRLGDKALQAAYGLLNSAPEGRWMSSHLYAIGKKVGSV